jgi:hypothetical protein
MPAAEQKPCVRCERMIDAYAKSCVYCGWDQSRPRPAEDVLGPAAPAYIPPPDHRARNRILGAAAFVVLVVVAFSVGSMLHRSDPVETKATQTASAPASPSPSSRSNIMLVPVEGGDSAQAEAPVTSAPAQPPSAGNVEVNGERTDATALPSDAYSVAAQRARAERDVRTNNGTVDPRTIVGNVESRPARSTSTEPARSQPQPRATRASSAPHTEPIPVYQPVPPMSVDRPTTARLFLTVGADGRVHDINITQSIPGEMPRLIASVQNWRFKPATEKGQPVTSTFSVDINVHPR